MNKIQSANEIRTQLGYRTLCREIFAYSIKQVRRWAGRKVHFKGKMEYSEPLVYVDPNRVNRTCGRIIQTDPREEKRHVQDLSRPAYIDRDDLGQIVDGGWDLAYDSFSEFLEYESLEAHFLYDTEWESTRLFDQHMERIEQGYSSYGCSSEDELYKRLEYIDKLYEAIRDVGYKVNSKVSESGYKTTSIKKDRDEIRIGIGDDGVLYYVDQGRHRLAISKLLDIDRIPVLITVIKSTEVDRVKPHNVFPTPSTAPKS